MDLNMVCPFDTLSQGTVLVPSGFIDCVLIFDALFRREGINKPPLKMEKVLSILHTNSTQIKPDKRIQLLAP